MHATADHGDERGVVLFASTGKPPVLVPECAAVLVVRIKGHLTVKFLLSLGFLTGVPVKIEPSGTSPVGMNGCPWPLESDCQSLPLSCLLETCVLCGCGVLVDVVCLARAG
jgi:hypothetical protein